MDTIRYFKSFDRHKKPYLPSQEIDFAKVGGLATYYKARYDDLGQLTNFTKYSLVRHEKREFCLNEKTTEDEVVYFSVKDDEDGIIDWDPILFKQTGQLVEYYKGAVTANQKTGTAFRYERVIEFDHNYVVAKAKKESNVKSDTTIHSQHYELVVLFDHSRGDKARSLVNQLTKLVKESSGSIHRREDWGVRQLAYAINGISEAHYFLMNIECGNKTAGEINSKLKNENAVLRHLIIPREGPITERSPLVPQELNKSGVFDATIETTTEVEDSLAIEHLLKD